MSENLAFCKGIQQRKLEHTGEKALATIILNKTSMYEQLLVKANRPSLNNRRLQDILILMYNMKHSMAHSYLCDLFSLSNKKYNLRNSDFNLPSFRTVRFGKHSIRYLGPHLWAKLSKKTRESSSLAIFKRKIHEMDITILESSGCNLCILCNS